MQDKKNTLSDTLFEFSWKSYSFLHLDTLIVILRKTPFQTPLYMKFSWKPYYIPFLQFNMRFRYPNRVNWVTLPALKKSTLSLNFPDAHMSQLMRLWYLSHRRPAKAQASLRSRAVSPAPSLFAHIKYGRRPKIRHLVPLDGYACIFEEWVYGGRKVP